MSRRELDELVYHVNPWYAESAQEALDEYWEQQGWVFIDDEEAVRRQHAANRLALADLSCYEELKPHKRVAFNLIPLQFMMEAIEESIRGKEEKNK